MKSSYNTSLPSKEIAEDLLVSMVNSYAFAAVKGDAAASWYLMEGVATMLLAGYTQDETNNFLVNRISSNKNIDPEFFVKTSIQSIANVKSKLLTLPDSFESVDEYVSVANNVVDAIKESYNIDI